MMRTSSRILIFHEQKKLKNIEDRQHYNQDIKSPWTYYTVNTTKSHENVYNNDVP